jgi:hypothetical protein
MKLGVELVSLLDWGLICVGDEVFASWCGVQVGFPSQVGVIKSRFAGRGVVDFLVSILGGRKPPHRVKVNPLGEGFSILLFVWHSIKLSTG